MKKFIYLLGIILFSINAEAANPDIFYYVSDGDNSLYTINRTTGAVTFIGATGVSNIEAIAFYPIPGANQLFATNAGDFGSLDTATGAFTLIGDVDGTGLANGSLGPQSLDDIDGLMLDGRTFKLWASQRRGGTAPDLLFQINPITGQFVRNAFGTGIDYLVVEGPGIDADVDDIAISPLTGRMYATSNLNGAGDDLISINKFTGQFAVQSVLSEDDIEGLAFSNNGLLYGSEGDGDNRLGLIDITTGIVSNFFTFTGSDVEALATLTADANAASGSVYEDLNFNGIKDLGEIGVANVRLELYIDNDGDGKVDPEDTRVQTTLSDGNGDYSFNYTSIGNLLVKTNYSTIPSGFALTTDNVETVSFTDNVNFGETDVDNNFGIAGGPDCDGEGIPDFFDSGIDSDGDGIANECDLDSDNDGIRDDVEGIEDFDDDGIPNYLDRDSDDDGIPDAIEANGGIIPAEYNSVSGNLSGVDSDGNGIIDSRETAAGSGVMIAPNPDSDNDGTRDYLDLDADNDGILDIIEAGGVDTDGDGQVDGATDLNNNGYSDLLESNGLAIPNTDATFETNNGLTLRPDYIDIDSDADGIDDTREGLSTANYRFPLLILDSDEDGIVDFWDVSTFNTPITPYDRDGDGIPDYQDTDSDNDGVADDIEGNDANSDGIRDLAFGNVDANNNGLDDAFDGDCGSSINSRATDYGEQTVSNGDMYLTSSDLELVNDAASNGGQQIVGLYFPGVNIAPGAAINSAYVQFEADEAETGPITITIEGHLIADAPIFTTTNSDISNRTRTTNSVTWSPGDWNTVGEIGSAQRTVDISSIINEIIAQGSWAQGNDIVLIFSGPAGNFRTAEVDPLLTILVESSICFSNVAVQDFDADGERDWRDNDDDDDLIPTFSEIPDADANGTPDYLEAIANACGPGFVSDTSITQQTAVTGAISQTNTGGVSAPNNALGTNTATEANIPNGGSLVLFFGNTTLTGTTYDINWSRQNPSGSGAVTMTIEESADGVSFTTNANSPSTSSKSLIVSTVTAGIDFQYLRITSTAPGLDIASVVTTVTSNDTTVICNVDTDGDGIPDADDIDDDNDGVLDINEGQGTNNPVGDEDGDGTLNYLDVVDNGNGGDGSTTNYTDANGDGIPDVFDTDNDGVPNHLDLDSDNDGIADIIEAGGVDLDNNGRVDNYADGDQDGWANTFDPDNGGTILNDLDSDGDGFENRLDIDADNDGIVDVIEAQISGATPKLPSGVDSDGDGIDDNFDADSGGALLVPVNTDGTDTPDYIDSDSDNDGISDLIEAYDTDRDNVADTLPTGTDADNDGLDDAFDAINGRNSSTNVSNNAQTSQSFPDDDNPFTPERDWREFTDTDGDGISDGIDIDDDNDGILDVVENLGCSGTITETLRYEFYDSSPAGSTVNNIPTTGAMGIGSVTEFDVDALFALVTPGDGNTFSIRYTGSIFISTEDTYTFYTSSDDGSNLSIDGVEIVDNDGAHGVRERSGSVVLTEGFHAIEVLFFENAGGEFLSVSYQSSTIAKTLLPFSILSETAICDTDADGIPDQFDLDSDNDGIADIIEAGGVDTNGDGRVDDDTDDNNNGWANTFDPVNGGTVLVDEDKDGDGLKNRIDLDADNDGIADIVEAGGEDVNGDGRADNFTDENFNGWSNTFDVNEAGESLPVTDTDGDGISNYLDLDSDSDGIIDNIEGQTTAAFQIPLGTDTDNDGWDDRYDSDDGGTAIVLSNNNGIGAVDYLDQDSDGDGQPDWMERADDDEDGDALLDLIVLANAYEAANANPNHYVATDDADNDEIPDFLEDADADGIPNFLDPDNATFFRDSDLDGVVDFYDADQNGDSRDDVTQLGELDNDGAPDFRDNDNNISLPIELIGFIATKVGNNVQLDWTTATEINNDYFTIERSADGEYFEPILTQDGAGTSSKIHHYRRFDNQPLKGYNYYRLKQTDLNGESEEFNIEVVKFETVSSNSSKYKVYPNPTTGRQLFLEIDQPMAGEYKVEIMSSIGKLIDQRSYQIESETIYFEQEMLRRLNLAKGVYFLRVQVNGELEVFKFIVQ